MRRLTITTKIWLSIGIFISGFVFSTLLGQVAGIRTENALRVTSIGLFPAAQQSQEAEAAFQRLGKGFSDAVIMQDASGLERASDEGRQVSDGLKSIAVIAGITASHVDQARTLAAQVEGFVADARKVYGAILANPGTITAETKQQMHELAARTNTIRASLKKMKESCSQDLRDRLSLIEGGSAEQRRLMILVFVVTLLVAGVIVHLTIRGAITGVLRHVVADLGSAADHAAGAASRGAASSHSLAAGSMEQAASLEQISASSEEISLMTQKNTEHSKEAAEKMAVAARQIDEANARLEEMMDSMNDINASSAKVSKIIRTIDEIAFQTNILALNAAVEAARAGESGMGFAVVANEVRNLAQRCAEAARDTTTLIEESISKTKGGKMKLDHVAATIHSVTSSAAEIKVLMDEINAASEEQWRGIRQVSAGLVQMEQVTKRNAAGAKLSASEAEELSSQSKVMEMTITRLAAMVNGDSKVSAQSQQQPSPGNC